MNVAPDSYFSTNLEHYCEQIYNVCLFLTLAFWHLCTHCTDSAHSCSDTWEFNEAQVSERCVKGRYFEIQTYSFCMLHSLILVLKYGFILLILQVSTDFSM